MKLSALKASDTVAGATHLSETPDVGHNRLRNGWKAVAMGRCDGVACCFSEHDKMTAPPIHDARFCRSVHAPQQPGSMPWRCIPQASACRVPGV